MWLCVAEGALRLGPMASTLRSAAPSGGRDCIVPGGEAADRHPPQKQQGESARECGGADERCRGTGAHQDGCGKDRRHEAAQVAERAESAECAAPNTFRHRLPDTAITPNPAAKTPNVSARVPHAPSRARTRSYANDAVAPVTVPADRITPIQKPDVSPIARR